MALEFHESEGDIFIYIRKLMSKMGTCVYKILTRALQEWLFIISLPVPSIFLGLWWSIWDGHIYSHFMPIKVSYHSMILIFWSIWKMKHNKVRRWIQNILRIWWTFTTQGHKIVLNTLHMWWKFSTCYCPFYQDKTVNWVFIFFSFVLIRY